MASGLDASFYNDGGEGLEWSNGQDTLLSASEQSSSESEVSAEQSVEQSPQGAYSEQTYDIGALDGYTLGSLSQLYAGGVCAGFAVAVCVALAAWAVTCAIQILKKGGK